MYFIQVTLVAVACAVTGVAGAAAEGPHHSTKKDLKPPLMASRLPRKSAVADHAATDLDPAIAYALPPAGLLHHGQGFGYGSVSGQLQGYDGAALAALLQQHAPAAPKKPVYPAVPLVDYGALLQSQAQAQVHATPIEEPRQEDTVQAVKAEAMNFIHSPKYYKPQEQEDEYKDYAAKYQFGYRVRDLHTGNDFGQTESRDGHYTHGHYHVLLPDGRLQNVQYWSDDSGFHAKVSYDGHAHH